MMFQPISGLSDNDFCAPAALLRTLGLLRWFSLSLSVPLKKMKREKSINKK